MVDAGLSGGLVVGGRRRRRSAEERRRVVEETLEPGSSVAWVARKHGVNANQVFQWRRLYHAGQLGPVSAGTMKMLPVVVSEEQELVQVEPVEVLAPRPGAIYIELPGEVRISVEGSVDPALVRMVMKSLRA